MSTLETVRDAPTAIEASTRRQRMHLVVASVTTVAVGLLCAALLYASLNEAMGRQAFVYALAFAFAPVLPLSAVFYWLNLVRPEPTRLLLLALLWGALVATLVSLRLNGWLAGHIGDAAGPRSAIFIAPWVEETAKAGIVFLIVWWRRHDFNSIAAGVIYGGLAGVGFAFTENIVYYGQIFQRVLISQGDNALALDAVQDLFWWRGVAAPFVHPLFTMMTGVGIGFAVRHRHVGVRILAPVAGFLAAVMLHMGYNTVATFAVADTLSAVYVGILVPTLLVAIALIAVVRRHELRVIAARLHDYTTYGWMKAEYIPFIVTRGGRRTARKYAAAISKAERAKMRAFQRTGMDLGVLRDRLVRGVAGEDALSQERDLITSVRTQRAALLLPPPVGSSGADVPAVASTW